MKKEILVSVIIPVRNSEKHVNACLESIIKQDFENFEIIVVDNNSNEKTRKIILDLTKKHKNLKYVFEPQIGRGAARNTGEKQAVGKIILMTDSDCVAPKNWIKMMIEPILTGEALAVQGGEVGLKQNFWSQQIDLRTTDKFNAFGSPGKIITIDTKNFAIKHEILENVGFTDRRYVSGNDTSLMISLLKKGIVPILKENIKIRHNHPDSFLKLVRKQFWRAFWCQKISVDNHSFLQNTNFFKETDQDRKPFSKSLQNLKSTIKKKGWKYISFDLISAASWRAGLIYSKIKDKRNSSDKMTQSPVVLPGSLWAVTSFYNPAQYKNKYENYKIFRKESKRQGLKLVTVELTFGDNAFEIKKTDAEIVIQIRGEKDNIMWQKEALLNIGLKYLPADCDKVVWIDCDIIFKNDNWIAETSNLLEKYKVIQPFEKVVRMSSGIKSIAENIKAEEKQGKIGRGISFASALLSKKNEIQNGKFFDYEPGLVCAIRREIIKKIGFYSHTITGSGDLLMARAFCGWPMYANLQNLPKASIKHQSDWLAKAYAEVQGSIYFTNGEIFHLWHGSTPERHYYMRHNILKTADFDPNTDVRINQNGILEWTTINKTIQKNVEDYFKIRNEEGKIQETPEINWLPTEDNTQKPDEAVTALVPIRNRYDYRIFNCLRSLRNQTYNRSLIKIILIDYGSDNKHKKDLEKLCETFNAKGIWVDNAEKDWSRAKCLNIGLKDTNTKYVITVDLDVVFKENYLETCIKIENKLVQKVGIYPKMVDSLKDLVNQDTDVVKNYDQIFQKSVYRGELLNNPFPYGVSILFLETKVLKEMGGFDEFYVGWGFEDIDLIKRLKLNGIDVVEINPQSSIFHQWHPRFEGMETGDSFKKHIKINEQYFEKNFSILRNNSEKTGKYFWAANEWRKVLKNKFSSFLNYIFFDLPFFIIRLAIHKIYILSQKIDNVVGKIGKLLKKNYPTIFSKIKTFFPDKIFNLEINPDFLKKARPTKSYPKRQKIGGFILVKGVYGLGNRIYSILMALVYAELTGRKILIDWTDGMYANRGKDAFTNLFTGLQSIDHYDNYKNKSIYPKIWKDRIDRSIHEIAKELGDNSEYPEPRDILSANFSNIKYKEEIIVLFDYAFRPSLFNKNLILRGMNKVSEDRLALANLYKSNIFLKDEIKKEINEFVKENFKKKMIGVHIRHTDNLLVDFVKYDKGTFIDKIIKSLDAVLFSNKDAGIFLSTDNKKILDEFRKKYVGVVSLDKFYDPEDFRPIHSSNKCTEKDEMAKHAVIDMYLLAQCNYLIYSSKSSFAKISTIISEADDSKIIDADPKEK